MTTISAPRIQSTPTDSDSVVHGVHVTCQTQMPYLVAICGTHVSWDSEVTGRDEVCVVCLDLNTCPICGVRLIHRSSDACAEDQRKGRAS